VSGLGTDDPLVERMRRHTTSIFAEMSALATATGAINLGQGFPDTDGPDEVVQAAVQALRDGHNQYPPGAGIPALRRAVADHQRRHYGLELDPEDQVLVTMGASEALASVILATCGPGDEVLTFEPWFDLYAAAIDLAGARRRSVTLRPPDLALDVDQLRRAVTPATRMLLLNTPHNPTGKVFTRAELEAVAAVCIEHDLIAVTDEVYEHLTFDGRPHVPLATLPGMAERTLSISSAGKTFSVTGWKIGWATGPAPLVRATRAVKQNLTYAGGTPFQHAVAHALSLPDDVVHGLRDELQARRDQLVAGLARAGFEVFVPEGTYFVTVDVRSVGATDGMAFCRSLPARAGVVAVPNAVFYDDPTNGAPFVRFACCKRRSVLAAAIDRLVEVFAA
jgi:N-succinyldiaminopimelate aminotransferase